MIIYPAESLDTKVQEKSQTSFLPRELAGNRTSIAHSSDNIDLSPIAKAKSGARREETRRYRARHPDRVAASKNQCKDSNRKRALDLLGGGCVVCGKPDNPDDRLEFHHTDPATKSFNIGAKLDYSFEKILIPELRKCELRCHEHHMQHHYMQQRGGSTLKRSRSPLNEADVLKIFRDKRPQTVIAKDYKITQATVSLIKQKRRKRWKTLVDNAYMTTTTTPNKPNERNDI